MVALDQYMMTELMMRALVMTMLCAPEIACLVLSVCALSPSPPLGASSPSHIFCQITQFKEHSHHPPHDHDCQYHLQHNHIHIITRLVRFPNCHECHSSSKWVGEPDYHPPLSVPVILPPCNFEERNDFGQTSASSRL